MIKDELVRKKVKSFHRRRSKQNIKYYVNSYGKDLIIWRCLCAFYTAERIEKENKRYLRVSHMIWLLAIKQYCIEAETDVFFMRDIKNYINRCFRQNKSAQLSVVVSKALLRGGYIIQDGLSNRTGFMLTMKARAFYRDLDELFQI